MKGSVNIVFILFILLAGCAQPEDSCQKINKTSDCLKYNNCNILENWKLRKIDLNYTSTKGTFLKEELYKDLLLIYNDGSMQFRENNVLSPLDKWEFTSCKELKLFSSKSDTNIVMTINQMEANAMVWQYNSTVVDTATWKVVNTIYFERM